MSTSTNQPPLFTGSRFRNIAEQLGDITSAQTNTQHLAELPRLRVWDFKHRGDYVLESWLHNTVERTSWIREHGVYLRRIITGDGGEVTTGKTFWLCNLCDKKKRCSMFLAVATSSPVKHLAAHSIYKSHSTSSSSAAALSVFSQLPQRPVTKSAADTF